MTDERISEYAEKVHKIFNGIERFKLPLKDLSVLPGNGLCITFERGQTCFDGRYNRIVHIGYNRSPGYFPHRIEQFFITDKSDATLKRHIGCALINKEIGKGEFLTAWWNRFEGISSFPKDKQKELKKEKRIYEKKVFDYIQENMSFAVLPLAEHRQQMKNRILYTLSQYFKDTNNNYFDSWLGKYSPNKNITSYGLWAEEYLKHETFLTDDDLNVIEDSLECERIVQRNNG